jgi:hypothetical protein
MTEPREFTLAWVRATGDGTRRWRVIESHGDSTVNERVRVIEAEPVERELERLRTRLAAREEPCDQCLYCPEHTATREDTERPDGDSHWATVVIEPENFEPRELTEAESIELDESGLGLAVERMWIRPGVRDTEQEHE